MKKVLFYLKLHVKFKLLRLVIFAECEGEGEHSTV